MFCDVFRWVLEVVCVRAMVVGPSIWSQKKLKLVVF
jgi:hypothetical protein